MNEHGKEMKSFPTFRAELANHNAAGYHSRAEPIAVATLLTEVTRLGWALPVPYLDFMSQVGPGRYFGGALTLYPFFGEKHSVQSVTAQLQAMGVKDRVAFAYDGTTEGCFCLSTQGNDEVYRTSWTDGKSQRESPAFYDWIERQPANLFNERVYRAYQAVKDPQAIQNIIEARRAFQVTLIRFDRALVRPPGRESDFLPRYHKVTFEVLCSRKPPLDYVTVECRRTGSSVGDKNIEYVALPVADLTPKVPKVIDAFLFDPFNVPFERMEVNFKAEIDLTSPAKVKFKEIGPFI